MAIFNKKTEETKEEKTAETKVQAADVSLGLPYVLVQPRVSEKSGHLVKLNKYVFLVKPEANKVEVKKAVESQYKVKVTSVNMVNTLGKFKNFGRTLGKRSDFKKAIVTLKAGDSIKGLTDVV
jgi:large subunit ribosomal protein L23